MILFVFEGAEREPKIFKTLERLFFGAGERIVCSFGNNIYELYRQLTELDGDGDIVSVLRENNAQLPDEYFVEYTISRKDCMERSFKDMAREFSFYGSLDFIELPDSGHRRPGKKEIAGVRQNWIWLVQQHTSKANFMCEGVPRMPVDKETVYFEITNGSSSV